MNLKIILLAPFLYCTICLSESVAQCAMCKVTSESNQYSTKNLVAGLNKGILYLMPVPYILVSMIAYLWYIAHKKHKFHNNKMRFKKIEKT